MRPSCEPYSHHHTSSARSSLRTAASPLAPAATRAMPIAFIWSTTPSTGARRTSGVPNFSKILEKTEDE